MNFSRPRIGRRLTRAHVDSLSTIYEEDEVEERLMEPSTSVGTNIQRVTAVQETKVNEKLWHIARLKESSSKACWAMMAVTEKQCESRIV